MKNKIYIMVAMILVLGLTACGGGGGSEDAGGDDDSVVVVEDSDAGDGEAEELVIEEEEEIVGAAEEEEEEVDEESGGDSENSESEVAEAENEVAEVEEEEEEERGSFRDICPDFNLELPFDVTYGQDGRLHTLVDGEEFITEFGAWGTHGAGHTGHSEDDAKTNWSVYLRPSDKLKEISSGQNGSDIDNDGICEEGETCGLNAADALASSPWYKAQHEGMVLTGVDYDTAQVNMQDYVTGEGMQWSLAFQVCGINLNLFHVGQLSDELIALLVERFGEEAITAPENVEFYWLSIEPMEIPKDMVIARPQVTFSFSEERNGETLYYAHAQVEWTANDSIACEVEGGFCSECAYQYFSEDDQELMQGALDVNLIDPITYGRFLSYGPDTGQTTGIYTAAHGALCASQSFSMNNFETILSDTGYTWLDEPMPNSPKDWFAIYPIHKEGGAYQEISEYYTSPDVDYMFQRSQVNFIPDLPEGYFSGQGEVITLDQYGDEGEFIVRTRTGTSLPDNDPGSHYFGAKFRLESNRLVVHWGSNAGNLDSLQMPDDIPEDVTCNGEPTFCYNHDFSTFYN